MPDAYMEALAGLHDLMGETAKSLPIAKGAQRKTQIDQTVAAALAFATAEDGIVETDPALIPIEDDGEPPSVAENVTLTPIIGGLVVTWDQPPPEERVKRAEIRFEALTSGTPPETVRADNIAGHTLLGLNHNFTYEVEVQLTDLFAQESGWSDPVQGDPMSTAIDEINLTEMAILGTLQGLLPNANLATIEDATKLGEGVVLAEAMAVQDAAAINLWVQDLAVEGAKIHSLVADKIVGGTILTDTIDIASELNLIGSGKLKTSGGGTSLDAGGVVIQPSVDYNTPTITQDQKISTAGEWTSLAFWNDSALDARGAVIRADGSSGGRRGAVVLHATAAGGLGAETSARVELFSREEGFGRVYLYEDVFIDRECTADDFILTGGRKFSNHEHGWDEINDKSHNHDWSDINNKGHKHDKGDIDGLNLSKYAQKSEVVLNKEIYIDRDTKILKWKGALP